MAASEIKVAVQLELEQCDPEGCCQICADPIYLKAWRLKISIAGEDQGTTGKFCDSCRDVVSDAIQQVK